MGTAYEGSLLQWIDQHGGATYSADQLFQMAQAEGKDYAYDKIRSARNTRRGVTIVLGPGGAPVRGTIGKQQQQRPKLGPGAKQRPGYFSGALRGKPEAPPPVPKKIGRPSNAELAARAAAAVDARQVAIPETLRTSHESKPGALDLGIRPKGKVQTTAVAEPVPKAPRKAIPVEAPPQPPPEPEHDEHHDELPPAKHTALRRLILDVGLDTAQSIIAEFMDVSERIR